MVERTKYWVAPGAGEFQILEQAVSAEAGNYYNVVADGYATQEEAERVCGQLNDPMYFVGQEVGEGPSTVFSVRRKDRDGRHVMVLDAIDSYGRAQTYADELNRVIGGWAVKKKEMFE